MRTTCSKIIAKLFCSVDDKLLSPVQIRQLQIQEWSTKAQASNSMMATVKSIIWMVFVFIHHFVSICSQLLSMCPHAAICFERIASDGNYMVCKSGWFKLPENLNRLVEYRLFNSQSLRNLLSLFVVDTRQVQTIFVVNSIAFLCSCWRYSYMPSQAVNGLSLYQTQRVLHVHYTAQLCLKRPELQDKHVQRLSSNTITPATASGVSLLQQT